MIRVVLDTNVWISSFLNPSNPPAQLRREIQRGGTLELCCSRLLLQEIEDVLSRPHLRKASRLTEEELQAFLSLIAESTHFFETINVVPVIVQDPDDDVVLATALAGKADLIISGDKHLLQLQNYQGILILTPRQLLDHLEGLESQEP